MSVNYAAQQTLQVDAPNVAPLKGNVGPLILRLPPIACLIPREVRLAQARDREIRSEDLAICRFQTQRYGG
jgi:hypothetical protein